MRWESDTLIKCLASARALSLQWRARAGAAQIVQVRHRDVRQAFKARIAEAPPNALAKFFERRARRCVVQAVNFSQQRLWLDSVAGMIHTSMEHSSSTADSGRITATG
jgi:hypothetical protein